MMPRINYIAGEQCYLNTDKQLFAAHGALSALFSFRVAKPKSPY